MVTPTFGRADLLPLAARSVLDQRFRDFEYLILDDGAADDMPAVVQQLHDPRVTLLRHEHRGEAATTNRGWAMGRGEYFTLLSSDDLVKPHWLERLVHVLDENPELLVAYPDYDVIDRQGNVTGPAPGFDYDRDRMIAAFLPFPGVGAVIRRSALRDLPALRNPDYRYESDLASWLRLSLRGPFARVPEILGSRRSHGDAPPAAGERHARAAEVIRIARQFFDRPGLGEDVLRLRPWATAQAYATAHRMLRDTHPLRAAFCLLQSYRIAPALPDLVPTALKRPPRPDYPHVLRLLGASLRFRTVAALRGIGRSLHPGPRPSGPTMPAGLLPSDDATSSEPVAQPAEPPPAPSPAAPPSPPDPARERIEAMMPQIGEDLAAFQDMVGVLSSTPSVLDTLRRNVAVLAAPALAQVTARALAALPGRVEHVLVVPWVSGIGGSETVTERLVEALRRLRGADGLCVIAPDAFYRAAGLARYRGLPFLGLSDIDPALDQDGRAEILDRLLVQRRPRVVHGVNSLAGWQVMRERGRHHAADSALFANIYSDVRHRDGAPAASYYYDYLPHCMEHLSSLIADNHAVLRRAQSSLGLGPALMAKTRVVRTPVIGLDGGDPARDLRPFRPAAGRRSLWLSRIAPEKRFDVLAQLAARCPGRLFEMRGADNGFAPDISVLRDRPNITIPGAFGSLTEIPWDDYDSYVFTTSAEGMPIALLEIAARGLPLIAPAVGGIGEFVTAETGWLIPAQDDVGAYAVALAEIEAEPAEARRRVAAAQALLLREHSRDAFDAALRAIPRYLGGTA